ncbi:glycosyltransferase [Thermomonas sp. HDW16]|uniref:glycosyltransferase n=1 Tax=Thermomonas sp. HDW16 TaxID=2714945 RepID=UPI00140DE243|nr:glycosyltransferase [Thermomonas sp. HDW16]QIL20510.1 glycosyltransferase [Thermomonas sp. HDW16]
MSQFVASYIPGRTIVIHNAFEDARFFSDGFTDRVFDFGFCGRLVSEKGVSILLEAFADMCRNERRLRLAIMGDGPERASLEEQARAKGIEENVTFTGSKDSEGVANMMRSCRVLVVPSVYEEPFGIVALEGLSSGCRVVVTRKGGLPEAVGAFGIVVDATPESLRVGMSSALSDCDHPVQDQSGLRRYLTSRRSEIVGRHYERVVNLVAKK